MQIGFQINSRAEALDNAALDLLRGIPTPIISDNMARMSRSGRVCAPSIAAAS